MRPTTDDPPTEPAPRPRTAVFAAMLGLTALFSLLPSVLGAAGVDTASSYPWTFSPVLPLCLYGAAFLRQAGGGVPRAARRVAWYRRSPRRRGPGGGTTASRRPCCGCSPGWPRPRGSGLCSAATAARCGSPPPGWAGGWRSSPSATLPSGCSAGGCTPHTPAGLAECFLRAVPFFRGVPLSLAVFLPVLFAPFAVRHPVGDGPAPSPPPRRDRRVIALATVLLLAPPSAHLFADGSVELVAGTGAAATAGDGGPAVHAAVNNPFGVAVGPGGGLFVCEVGGHRLRRIDPATGLIDTVAGTGEAGYSGDGGPATQARLNEPYEIAFDAAGRWVVVDRLAHVVRRIDPATGLIETVAGTGEAGFSGDGGPATAARLNQPHSVCFGPDGTLYICDIRNHRVRAVDAETGVIRTFAGTGAQGRTPDGAPLAGTPLSGPRAIAPDPRTGDLFLALREGNAVYRVAMETLTLHHVAGTGKQGYTGDGADARRATLSGPKGIAVAPNGDLILADTESHTVRLIDRRTNIIRTLAGTGARGDAGPGDPGPVELARPHGVFAGDDRAGMDGPVLIGDSENHRVLRWVPGDR